MRTGRSWRSTFTAVRTFRDLDPTLQPDLGIGTRRFPYNAPFNGLIDELSVYDLALSPTEINGISSAGGAGKIKAANYFAPDYPSVSKGPRGPRRRSRSRSARREPRGLGRRQLDDRRRHGHLQAPITSPRRDRSSSRTGVAEDRPGHRQGRRHRWSPTRPSGSRSRRRHPATRPAGGWARS